VVVKTGTSNLHLVIEGMPSSESVLFLHGGPGVPDYLGPVSKLLRKHFQVLRFDQRGAGKSICLDGCYDIDAYLSDIEQIVSFVGTGKVHLFGHSWGGLLAQLWAWRHPKSVRSLFLCSPSSGTGEVWKRMEQEVLAYNREKASGAEWAKLGIYSLLGMLGLDCGYKNAFRLLWRFYFESPGEAPDADEDWLSGIRADAVNKTRRSLVSFENHRLDEGLEGFDAPVLVVFGRKDIYGPSKALVRKRLPCAAFKTIENAGHLPWLQNSVAFEETLYQFYGLPTAA